MCLSVPGKVVSVSEGRIVLDYSGETREVALSLVDLTIGDYCLVSGGVVVSKIEKEKAVKFLEMINE